MVVTIPCDPTLTSYDLQVALDGVTYTLEFRWNFREEAWYMDIRTEDGTNIVVGRKVVCGVPLGARSPNALKPPGWIVATDTTRRGLSPGIADLGDRVQLVYIELADFA